MKLWVRFLAICLGSISSLQAVQNVTLAWDANSEPDIAGYRLKYGTSSGNYVQTLEVGGATTATVSNLVAGNTYFFVVTTYNMAALESAPSSEVSFTVAGNQAPTVSLTSPGSGSSWSAPASLTLNAIASDGDGSIGRVEFYSGTTKLGEDSSSPYTFTWSGVAPGSYSLSARAFDNQGVSTDSAPVSVTVTPQAVPRAPSIRTVEYLPYGVFQLTVKGDLGAVSSLYASSDMVTWTLLSTFTNTSGPMVLTDQAISDLGRRFYRVSDVNGISAPAGFTTVQIAGATLSQSPAFSYIGITMMEAVSYEGTVGVSQTRTISDPLAGWADHQFNGVNGEFYIEIVSGPNAGVTADIVETNAYAKTLITDDDLSSLLAGGENYRIRKHRTLGDIFGRNNEAGMNGGATVSGADEIRVFNPVTQTFITYYYKTGGFGGLGWRATTDAVTDASGSKLYPDQGVIIKRKTPGASKLVLKGAVKTGPTVVPVGTGTNLVANVYPAGTLTLGNSGLRSSDDTTGIAGGSSVSTADEVRIFDGTAFRTYFYKTGGFGGTGWRDTTNALIDASMTVVPASSSIFVIRKTNRPPFGWTMPQPF